MENVKLNEDFTQVCVWPGTLVENIKEFEKFIFENFKTRIQYLEEIVTNPTPGDDETGGRNDVFFAVHNEDIGKFAITRLAYGIRWIEDVYGNNQGYLYPERVKHYKSWETPFEEDDDYDDSEDGLDEENE